MFLGLHLNVTDYFVSKLCSRFRSDASFPLSAVHPRINRHRKPDDIMLHLLVSVRPTTCFIRVKKLIPAGDSGSVLMRSSESRSQLTTSLGEMAVLTILYILWISGVAIGSVRPLDVSFPSSLFNGVSICRPA